MDYREAMGELGVERLAALCLIGLDLGVPVEELFQTAEVVDLALSDNEAA